MDNSYFEKAIIDRLTELGARVKNIDDELGHLKTQDFGDQAIDLEDDEVLEGLGLSAQKEIGLLKRALARIHDKTYGICLTCDQPISEERLDAVLYAPLCRTCANGTAV